MILTSVLTSVAIEHPKSIYASGVPHMLQCVSLGGQGSQP